MTNQPGNTEVSSLAMQYSLLAFIAMQDLIPCIKRHREKARANSDLYPPGWLCIVLEKD